MSSADLPFSVQITPALEDGRWVCQELRLTRKPGERPIRSFDIRRIKIETLLKQDRPQPSLPARVDIGSPLSLAVVVNVYRSVLANPLTRDSATQAVADQLGKSRGHVSRLLTQARRKGLLASTERGRGGRPTQGPNGS